MMTYRERQRLEEQYQARAEEIRKEKALAAQKAAELADQRQREIDARILERVKAKRRAAILASVANRTSAAYRSSATDQWRQAVNQYKAQGHSNHEAVRRANANNPGLRERMLAEVNHASC